jgi:predicted RND superfamily exporter protein
MIRTALRQCIEFVTKHNRITLLVMLLLTGVVVAGIPQIDTSSQGGGDASDFEHLDRVQAAQYVETNYGTDRGSNVTVEPVYVREDDGNVLSKESLLAGLRYQRAVSQNESLQAALQGDGTRGFENLVATRAADERRPDLDEQIRALERTSPAEVRRLVGRTLAENPGARRFLPADHETEPTASDRRMLVTLSGETPAETRSDATKALYETANDRSGFFTLGEHAADAGQSHFFNEMVELVLPLALLIILAVLAFTYRDLVDVVVGMTGVVLSVLWMFGLLGWFGVTAGIVSIVPVVLITGLSVDFGFHVFNRYREQRGEEDGIRDPMSRGVRRVATALVLVTVTAAIGFLSNVVNPLPMIRDLGITITLGVISSFVLFLTVVPALKISVDGLLERFGVARHKRPLGRGRHLEPLLRRNVMLARRAAPAVLAVAIVLGAVGGLAWASLDQQSFQQSDGDVAEWKQELPEPIGWEPSDRKEQYEHVQEVYHPASDDDVIRSRILIEGNVTADGTLEALHDGVGRIEGEEVLLERPNKPAVTSPLTAMRAAAQRNESFAAAFRRADTDRNGVPDTDLAALYDRLYAIDSDTASRVVERTDGEYRSVLVRLSVDGEWANAEPTVSRLETGATTMGGAEADRKATVAGHLAVNQAVLDELVDGILLTMAVALLAILATLAIVFRVMHGSASLGVAVSVPIALVIGFVVGGMSLLDIPLTVLTALLMSLVVGLGVDYNIHVGDRFADERRAGKPPVEALRTAVTATGGALLGSTLTSAGAFTTLVLVPHPQLQSLGSIVVIALLTAFLSSVLVLPSLLILWERYGPESVTTPDAPAAVPGD